MRPLLSIVTICSLVICVKVSGQQNEKRKMNDLANCTSVLEASLVSDTLYSSKPPYLILRKSYNTPRAFRGAILSLSDSGVVFLRAKDGLYTPDPKFYPVENIECLIDSNNRVRLGNWKGTSVAFWNIELLCQRIDSSETKLFTIVLEPNKTVSYCIEPGEYKIVQLLFRGFDDYVDQSDSLCCSRFTVRQNAVTYIGSFKLEYKWTVGPDMVVVPTTVANRPGMGWSGGLLQYFANKERAEKEKAASPFHAVKAKIDSAFIPISKNNLILNLSPVTFEQTK